MGAKLAGSTILLILAVAGGVYVALSHTQRENLLQAKERSASAVTQLFVDSCGPGVVFGDAASVQDELTTLGRNDDVEYAAVWSADPAGRLTSRVGELRHLVGREALREVPSATWLRRERDHVVISSPVLDRTGKAAGATMVVFSLARENRAIASIERNTLLTSGVVAIGLVLLLILMARLVVVGPLRKLVAAAQELEHGGEGAIDIRSGDEVGRLARAFRSMASAIRIREERIEARNLDMRMVLDNVGQGFVTLDLDGTISAERSRVVDEWFGAPAPGARFWEYLGRQDAVVGEWFELGWSALSDAVLPLSLCLDQLPKLSHKDDRTFELAYRPILDGDQLKKVIVVITDVTARVERERAEQAQRELMCVFRRLLSDRVALDDFLAETTRLIDAITSASTTEVGVLMRHIHTVKGNAALFGLESVAAYCHELETDMAERRPLGEGAATLLSRDQRDTLGALWGRVLTLRSELSQSRSAGSVEIEGAEYDRLLRDLRSHLPHEALLRNAAAWRFELASKRLELIGDQIRGLASRLGRGPVAVSLLPTDLRLSGGKWGALWSAFAHLVRNTVDHGLETPEARAAAGKAPQARIELGIARQNGQVIVSIADDGPGIDWVKIAGRARDGGLPHTSRLDLEAALFVDGVSSRGEATATSGRGVGLGVVRELVDRLHGRIEIDTAMGRGTTFRLVLPESMLTDETPLSGPGASAGSIQDLPEMASDASLAS